MQEGVLFAEYPPLTAGESGQEMVGAKANSLKSEIMGEGRRNGNRSGGQAGNRSERKGGKAGSFPSFYEKMALPSLGGGPGEAWFERGLSRMRTTAGGLDDSPSLLLGLPHSSRAPPCLFEFEPKGSF